MHLHIWKKDRRRSGYGINLLKKTIPYYFENFEIEKLICEPYALNPAPTKVGPFEVVAEVVPNPRGEEVGRIMREAGIDISQPAVSRVRIQRSEETVATVRVEEGSALAATLLPDLDVLIIKSPGRIDMLTFIDLRHGRVMWRFGLRELLKGWLDAKPKNAI